MSKKKEHETNKEQEMPDIHTNEYVEYSEEFADADDLEAQRRAEEADQRAKNRDF